MKPVEIPEDIVTKVTAMKGRGELNQLAGRAGLNPGTVYAIGRKHQRTIGAENLQRLQRALAGEAVPKPDKPRKRKKPKGTKLVRRVAAELMVHQLPPARGHHEIDPVEIRGVLNGLALGVSITRQTILELLSHK
jgi:hypothetical protein